MSKNLLVLCLITVTCLIATKQKTAANDDNGETPVTVTSPMLSAA